LHKWKVMELVREILRGCVLGEVLLAGILVDGTLEFLTCQEECREVPQSCSSGAIEDTVDKIVLEAGCSYGSKMLLG
jgi:hypothetical protein